MYGFAVQDSSFPLGDEPHVAEAMLQHIPAERFSHLVAFGRTQIGPGYDFGDEFDFGLDLILDGARGGPIGRRRRVSRRPRRRTMIRYAPGKSICDVGVSPGVKVDP